MKPFDLQARRTPLDQRSGSSAERHQKCAQLRRIPSAALRSLPSALLSWIQRAKESKEEVQHVRVASYQAPRALMMPVELKEPPEVMNQDQDREHTRTKDGLVTNVLSIGDMSVSICSGRLSRTCFLTPCEKDNGGGLLTVLGRLGEGCYGHVSLEMHEQRFFALKELNKVGR